MYVVQTLDIMCATSVRLLFDHGHLMQTTETYVLKIIFYKDLKYMNVYLAKSQLAFVHVQVRLCVCVLFIILILSGG